MGTMSVPCQWDWQTVKGSMERMPDVRALDDEQLDELYEQLEIMERSAIEVLNEQFNKQCSG